MLVEIENRDCLELSPAIENITNVSKKRKKVLKCVANGIFNYFNFVVLQDSPSPIALEPCNGNRAAVLSLLVRLPTGKRLKSFYMVV